MLYNLPVPKLKLSQATQTDNIAVAAQTSCDKETITVGAQPQSGDTLCTSPSGEPHLSQVFSALSLEEFWQLLFQMTSLITLLKP